MMSGQQCGLAGSTLLSQADVFIWFVPYFIPLLLFCIFPPNLPFKLLSPAMVPLVLSPQRPNYFFFIACPNPLGQMALLKSNIFEELIFCSFLYYLRFKLDTYSGYKIYMLHETKYAVFVYVCICIYSITLQH